MYVYALERHILLHEAKVLVAEISYKMRMDFF